MVSRIRNIWTWALWKTTSSKRNVRSSYQKKQNNPLRAWVWIIAIVYHMMYLIAHRLRERWQILLCFIFSVFFMSFFVKTSMIDVSIVLESPSHAAWTLMTIPWMHTHASFKSEAVSIILIMQQLLSKSMNWHNNRYFLQK